ncbi:tRNA threonylcarbamoyladenosine dehydratase [Carboxydothermus pertinax]|uniref:tRNA threonylcarbamoyladenosine dehydratase n=1 Tax=Carboxydothermus pertinax TaxID=870242 RepID=A0A1L8CSC6_9THEO|nr:tRNA threonylcarbamoyladenosine dehydratase [Carboxydothermus pertinax]GAV21719.1 tRNA threonylcarbamoyladenosine dehydratase [Carboxydothermus pertinax]
MHRFSRTKIIIGSEGLEVLHNSRVMVFGLGGVGSPAVEALARTGVGSLVLVDFDRISVTNINRQLPALDTTVGMFKAEVLAKRIQEINPKAEVVVVTEKITPVNAREFLDYEPDYVIEAIDTLKNKIALISLLYREGVPFISVMGAGNRLDPTKFKVADISQTHTCPLARRVRQGLKKEGIYNGVKVVFSEELPLRERSTSDEPLPAGKKHIPGSIMFVTATAGLIAAGEAVKDLLRTNKIL